MEDGNEEERERERENEINNVNRKNTKFKSMEEKK